jgi:hypothetical protein
MICSKCKYYAPLTGRSYDLRKCLKLQMFTNPCQFTKSAIEICKGKYSEPKFSNTFSIRSNELIKK